MNDKVRLRIGSCSWKYPSWAGIVYSSPDAENFLEEYSRVYDTVEIDQWFWSLPSKQVSADAAPKPPALPRMADVTSYEASTGPDFRFSVKCPNALTLSHYYAKRGEALIANPFFMDPDFFLRFLSALAPLAPKLGILILQFEYLNKDKMPSREAFLSVLAHFLDALPEGLPLAIEIRNPRWMDGQWFDFLASHRVAPVILQGYWMDDAALVLEKYGENIGDTVCIRLHGEDREGMEEKTASDWSRIVRPKDADIDRIMNIVVPLLDGGREVFLNVNNHYEGCAPKTIEKIKKSIEGIRSRG